MKMKNDSLNDIAEAASLWKLDEYQYLSVCDDGMVAVADFEPQWSERGKEWRSVDAFEEIPPPPEWLKPGQLWKRECSVMEKSGKWTESRKHWDGYWWQKIADHNQTT
jgi:hypothetical protein